MSAMTTKINIAIPAYGSQFRSALVRSMFPLLVQGSRKGIGFSFSEIDYSDLAVARNYLLSNFYFHQTDCSHILMLDIDMGFPVGLIGEMLAIDKPMVGAIYPKRQIDLKKLHAAATLPFDKALACSVDFVGKIHSSQETRGNFVRMDWCGGGILLISRGCIEQMTAAMPEIIDRELFRHYGFGVKFTTFLTAFDRIKNDTADLSEDQAFCRRWVERCDGEIWASFAHRISHVGSLQVTVAYADLLK